MFKNWMDLRLWKTFHVALWKDTALYFSCFVFLSTMPIVIPGTMIIKWTSDEKTFFFRFCCRSKEKHFYRGRWKSTSSLQIVLIHKCLYLSVIHHLGDWMQSLLSFRTKVFNFNFLNFVIFASFWLLMMNNSSNAFGTGKKQV